MGDYNIGYDVSRGDAALVLDKIIAYLSAMRVVIPQITTEADGSLSVYGGMTTSDKKELAQCIKALRVIMNAHWNSEYPKYINTNEETQKWN